MKSKLVELDRVNFVRTDKYAPKLRKIASEVASDLTAVPLASSYCTLVYPLGETPCVRRTTFLPGDTTAETPGSHRACNIFVIGPLVLSAGVENYAKPLRRLSSLISYLCGV
jgi:hypothetical protein